MISVSPHLTGRLNSCLSKIAPNEILSFDARVSMIPDMVKLTLGEPDFDVPEALKEAAVQSIVNNESHYAPVSGTPALREAIAHFLKDRYGLAYDPAKEICVTCGATEAIYMSLKTFINSGDKILIPTPTFPLYASITLLLGGEPVYVNTKESGFVLTADQLEGALAEHGDAIKAVVLNYPSNPTGATYTSEQLQAIAAVLSDKPVAIIADEIYSELVYEGEHHSIAEYAPGQTLILNGASKSHAMTGYRIGFVAGPAALIGPVTLNHAFATTTLANSSMAAAACAFSTEEGKQATTEMREQYQARRDYLATALAEVGFESVAPTGAFYLFVKIPDFLEQNDEKFANELADEAKVAVIAGRYFGPGGDGYLRLSYATSMDVLQEAVKRIAAYADKKRA